MSWELARILGSVRDRRATLPMLVAYFHGEGNEEAGERHERKNQAARP